MMVDDPARAEGAFRTKMDSLTFQVSNQMERFQVQASILADDTTQKLRVVYSQFLTWLEALNLQERLRGSLDVVGDKTQEIKAIFRNLRINNDVARFLDGLKGFLFNEVSKQAIYFGFAGLVTGGVIGLCIGYSVKSSPAGSGSPPYSMSSNGSAGMMRAILCSSSRRGLDGITISTIPIPSFIDRDEILVHVKAIAIDNIDAKVASGYGHCVRQDLGLPSVSEPFVLGRECSGTVIQIGPDVRSFEVNDRVWILLPLWAPEGVMSEFIVVSEQFVGHKPRNIGFEGAATLPYAANCVWKSILNNGRLGARACKNKRVLIHLGASSKNDGVGLLATQVLKGWGARVTISTVETPEDEEEDQLNASGVAQMTFLHTLKSLGAESHIIIPCDPALIPDLAQRIFDIVVNTDSAHLTAILSSFLKDPHDSVIETFPRPLVPRSWGFPVSIFRLLWRKVPERDNCQLYLDECKKMVESGLVVPVVAKSFLASQYDQAFRHVASSSNSALAHAHVGKSVLVFKVP